MSDELWRWDAVRVAQAMQTRVVSSKEVVAACLARLESVNLRMNAVDRSALKSQATAR
jgi:amidase